MISYEWTGPVQAFAVATIRRLYVEGLCGGAIVPMSRLYGPHAEVHVPVAHQSAIAGVLVASALVAEMLGLQPAGSRVTRRLPPRAGSGPPSGQRDRRYRRAVAHEAERSLAD